MRPGHAGWPLTGRQVFQEIKTQVFFSFIGGDYSRARASSHGNAYSHTWPDGTTVDVRYPCLAEGSQAVR